MTAAFDAFTERAAIMWSDRCTCDPKPQMALCKCGARDECEAEAATACGVLGWASNPAVRSAVRKWEDGLWR